MKRTKGWIIWLLLALGIYFLTRLMGIGKLPVFADEAIYIRWAQMIANEPGKYLFLPMYDGKTPLMMWLLPIFLWFNPGEPVVMARLASVVWGLMAMVGILLVTKILGGKKTALFITALIYVFLPYTFFHDRMALTDTLYMACLAWTVWLLGKLKQTGKWRFCILAGIGFGLSMWAKLPGLLFIIEFLLILWLFPPALTQKDQPKMAIKFGLAALIGLSMLYALRISELFPFLFNRGADFTFTFKEMLNGQWAHWWLNIKEWFAWQIWYSSVGLWLLLLAPLFWLKGRKSQTGRMIVLLIIMAMVAAAYFIVAGKIVYSRYYLPLEIFLIPAASLAAEWLWQQNKRPIVLVAMGAIMVQGIWFMKPLWLNINRTHLEIADQHQYLTDWSAGFGNKEAAAYFKQTAAVKPIAVATEGYFGTLPDGLSIYFDRSPLNDKVKIFGVGEPITGISPIIKEAASEKETYIIVNQDRLKFDYSMCCSLVAIYARPYNGAPLLLLKIDKI